MSKKKKEKSEEKVKTLPLEWHTPDDIITRFASNIIVQIIEYEFKVSFFEIKPEVYLEKTQIPRKIKADCVASVIVSVDRLPNFIDALQRQLDVYNKEVKPQKE